jgi:hypothetical protein
MFQGVSCLDEIDTRASARSAVKERNLEAVLFWFLVLRRWVGFARELVVEGQNSSEGEQNVAAPLRNIVEILSLFLQCIGLIQNVLAEQIRFGKSIVALFEEAFYRRIDLCFGLLCGGCAFEIVDSAVDFP